MEKVLSNDKRGPNKVIQLICEECNASYTLRRLPGKNKRLLCAKCRKIENDSVSKRKNAQYYKKPEYRRKAREWRLKNIYGIDQSIYDTLFDQQNGVCAICKRSMKSDNSEYLVVDHDHLSGKIRGLLCDKCNRALGAFKEDPVALQNAIVYLVKSSNDHSWDRYFLNIAALVSTRSKDPSTQVGAVLVKEGVIISTGYNGFPRGCNDAVVERYSRPLKYDWTVHAEENALLNAGRQGVSTRGTTMYITPIVPCFKCVRAMIQCGVTRIVCQVLINPDRWLKEFEVSKQMMQEAGIDYVEII